MWSFALVEWHQLFTLEGPGNNLTMWSFALVEWHQLFALEGPGK
jgi:hypothetical protein